MKRALSQIDDTAPRRQHGDVTDLRRSIADVGLINPITIDEQGRLLAGHRRFQAVAELGWEEVDVRVLPVEGDQLMAFRVTMHENLKRKPLSDPEVAASIKEYDDLKRQIEGSARRGERTDLTSPHRSEVWTHDKTADDFGVSRQAVGKAIQIATAIEDYPELASYQKGAPILKEYAKRKRQEEPMPPQTDGDIQVILGDMREELELLPDECASLVLTDPPYPEEYLPLWGDMARIAARVLKPSGFLVAYSGQLYLDQVMRLVGEYLSYYWMAGVVLKGAPSHRFERNVQNAYKPVLIYQKPPLTKQDTWFVDLLESPAADKQYHEWGQSERPFVALTETFSNPGDLVIEPFCGGGVVPFVCKQLGRKCIAVDNNEDCYRITMRRLQGDE